MLASAIIPLGPDGPVPNPVANVQSNDEISQELAARRAQAHAGASDAVKQMRQRAEQRPSPEQAERAAPPERSDRTNISEQARARYENDRLHGAKVRSQRRAEQTYRNQAVLQQSQHQARMDAQHSEAGRAEVLQAATRAVMLDLWA